MARVVTLLFLESALVTFMIVMSVTDLLELLCLDLAMDLCSDVDDGSGLGAGLTVSGDECTVVPACSVDVAGDARPLGSLSVDSSAESSRSAVTHPRRVWVWVDFEMYKRASGLPGVMLWISWSRWLLHHHSRGSLCGDDDTPKIAVELEVLREAPVACRDASVTVSSFARGEGSAPVAASGPCVWLFFDFELFSRASGLRGRELQSAWARWWTLAEARGDIWGTADVPTIGLELLEVPLDP